MNQAQGGKKKPEDRKEYKELKEKAHASSLKLATAAKEAETNIKYVYRMVLRSIWGEYSIWFGGGVLLEPQNPYPFLRVIFAEKGTHFSQNIGKREICLRVFALKSRPMSKDFHEKK